MEYVNEHLKKYPYAIGISLVNKEGNIINKLVCNFPMKMEYANADGWQYDWETGELEYKYNLKTI